MAKKKQLAGKKTKLAKLPLTRVLAGQGEEPAPLRPSPGASTLPSFFWEEAEPGAGGPLASTYLFLIRELASLRAQLQSVPEDTSAGYQSFLPRHLPPPQQLQRALQQARQSLSDLDSLLSRP